MSERDHGAEAAFEGVAQPWSLDATTLVSILGVDPGVGPRDDTARRCVARYGAIQVAIEGPGCAWAFDLSGGARFELATFGL